MSLDASGKLGGAIVFSSWKGRHYARILVKPSNPRSAAQTSVRSVMKFLSQQWAALTAGEKTTWAAQAETTAISPFNAYVSYNLNRWTHFKTSTQSYPAVEVAATPSAPTTTPAAGVKEIQLSIVDGATPPTWGWAIFRSTVTGFTPSFSNLVQMVPRSGTPTVYVDKPLTTGVPYYYRIKGFMDDGKGGTLEAERTATPT
jgi:hypothetical protein